LTKITHIGIFNYTKYSLDNKIDTWKYLTLSWNATKKHIRFLWMNFLKVQAMICFNMLKLQCILRCVYFGFFF
jgi:hypothetical protein